MNELVPPDLFQKMVAVRRDLHQHPELSGQEFRTADTIMQFLKNAGLSNISRVANTGVVAEIPGPSHAPWIVLRADTDALPIQEETNLAFSSVNEGIMHACGHDGHTAMLLGAAALLAKDPQLAAPVRFIFQPSEERGSGAIAMIKEGVLENAGMIFGGHLDRHYPTGTLVVTDGPVNASTDTFVVEILGQGAHGARPHESIDAVVVGSLLVMALQTIVSREVDPAFPSVVSIGRFQSGTASNVIAGQARLEGTIRAQHPNVRTHLHTAIERIARSIGQLHGANITTSIDFGTPPVINSPEMAALSRQGATLTVGQDNVVPLRTANMGGEDFSYYLEKVPGAYIRFGSQVPGLESFPAHSSKFDFDEQSLAVGASYFHHMAILAGQQLLNK